jgi:hypothetical protein
VLGLGAVLPAERALAADDDIFFAANLTADDESTPTESPGSGRAELRLERATLKLTWKITFQGLTAPATSVALYGPENVGATAGMVVDLVAPHTKRVSSPITGSAVLSDGAFGYLITGRMYVNILTTHYKEGELRGQLRRQRKPLPVP